MNDKEAKKDSTKSKGCFENIHWLDFVFMLMEAIVLIVFMIFAKYDTGNEHSLLSSGNVDLLALTTQMSRKE